MPQPPKSFLSLASFWLLRVTGCYRGSYCKMAHGKLQSFLIGLQYIIQLFISPENTTTSVSTGGSQWPSPLEERYVGERSTDLHLFRIISHFRDNFGCGQGFPSPTHSSSPTTEEVKRKVSALDPSEVTASAAAPAAPAAVNPFLAKRFPEF